MSEITNKINNLNIDNDLKEFINTRTSKDFQEQYYFYYQLSESTDRAMIRAIEETLMIQREEWIREDTEMSTLLYGGKSDTEIVNELKTQYSHPDPAKI